MKMMINYGRTLAKLDFGEGHEEAQGLQVKYTKGDLSKGMTP